MSTSPTAPVCRPEFETLQKDVRAIERTQTLQGVQIDGIARQITRQESSLNEIKDLLHNQQLLRVESEKAMRRMIWAANMLGPKSIAMAALLVSLLYEWLRR